MAFALGLGLGWTLPPSGAGQPAPSEPPAAPRIESGMRPGAHPAEVLRVLDGDTFEARVALDKYGGRVVADVSTPATPDVSAALIAAGLGRRYAGGRRDGWC